MSLEDKLNKSLNSKEIIKIQTNDPDNEIHHGVVLSFNKKIVVFMLEDDFEFRGIIILAKKFIKNASFFDNSEWLTRIINHNQEIKKLKVPLWLKNIESIEEVLKIISSKKIWPAIEIIFKKDEELDSEFYLGKVLGGNNKECFMECFNSHAEWDEENYYTIKFNEVYKIELDTPYVKHFTNYMKAKNSSKISKTCT